MSNIIKANPRVRIIYCGNKEFRNSVGFHSENPTPDELRYACILAETRGHDTVYAHYTNVISFNPLKKGGNKEEDLYVNLF